MALQASGIADLLTTTLEAVEKLKFTDISSDLQKYTAMSRMMKKKKTVFDAGADFGWDLMTNDNGSAAFKGLYAQDVVGVNDVMARGKVPWRHVTWNWAIERREIAMNRSPNKIVDLAMVRRIASFISAVKLFENKFWRVPAFTNDTDPYGVPYYVVKSASEGFNASLPATSYTTVANIAPSSYLNSDGTTRWGNWAFQYTGVTRDDLIRKWRKAVEFTDFDTPMPDMPTFDSGDDMGFYTNWGIKSIVEEILRTNNDDLGPDLAAYANKTMFMGNPVERVPQLDEDTTNPIYGIQWGEWITAGLRGEWLNETVVPHVSGQHTVAATFTDCSINFATRNRRRNFVGSTGTTLP